MQHKASTLNGDLGGPAAATVADALREKIASGDFLAGQFLPSVRKLSADMGHAPQTIHRAVKRLAAEGLVRADSSRGYLVMPGANDPLHGCPLAYAYSGTLDPEKGPFHTALRAEIEAAAARRGWSFLIVGGPSIRTEEIMSKLRSQRAFAVCL
ncbi:MAG: winged helix-turn-helix domain-containing protein, partial [Planctomycetota bacterium]